MGVSQWAYKHIRPNIHVTFLSPQNLEFEGIMRFYFQSTTREAQQKVATKCIRVSNTASTNSVIEALVQKFRPDLRMLTNQSSYALYEVHSNEGELNFKCNRFYSALHNFHVDVCEVNVL